MSFYVTLPSNASPNIFPNNKPGHFYVKLPQTLDLNSRYEVGLAEIQFPTRYFNVLPGDVWIRYYSPSETNELCKPDVQLTLPAGYYHSPVAFLEDLNLLITEQATRSGILANKPVTWVPLRFFYNKTTSRVSLSLYDHSLRVKISEPLKYILGFTSNQVSSNVPTLVSTTEVDLDITSNNVYIYCDIVAPRVVGDAMVPLLRTVPNLDRRSTIIFRVYDKPHYIPLNRFSFDTLEILLSNELGQTLPFVSGTSVVTLHFRERRNYDL